MGEVLPGISLGFLATFYPSSPVSLELGTSELVSRTFCAALFLLRGRKLETPWVTRKAVGPTVAISRTELWSGERLERLSLPRPLKESPELGGSGGACL